MILPDVNVWLALAHQTHDDYISAVNWLLQVPKTEMIAFCRHSQLGFLRNSSNPRVTKGAAPTKDDVWKMYDDFYRDRRITYVDEPSGVDIELRRLMCGMQNNINLWTDAYLAAFAIVAGCQLVSFDDDFIQFSGLNFHKLP